MTTKNRLSYHLRGNKFRSNSREREETENSQQDFFSSSLFQEAARIRSKECCLPPLASLRLVSHMITLLSSLVISLSERHLVSAKTAISSHRSSCLLCFKHFRSSVKRSSIDTRSVVWVPFHISPPVPIFISPVNIEASVMRCIAGRSPSVFSRRPSLGPSVWAYVFPSPTYASCDVMQETVANHVGDISFALSLAL